MDIQYLIVIFAILAAVGFAGRAVLRRTRSFAVKSDCGTDCGCGGESRKAST